MVFMSTATAFLMQAGQFWANHGAAFGAINIAYYKLDLDNKCIYEKEVFVVEQFENDFIVARDE